MLNMTRWRIVDQLRRRRSRGKHGKAAESIDYTKLELPDGQESFEDYWEREWQQGLLEMAKKRVKQRVDPAKYQLYHLYVTKEIPPQKVAQTMGITVKEVYMAKHRVSELIKEELKRLEKGFDEPHMKPR